MIGPPLDDDPITLLADVAAGRFGPRVQAWLTAAAREFVLHGGARSLEQCLRLRRHDGAPRQASKRHAGVVSRGLHPGAWW